VGKKNTNPLDRGAVVGGGQMVWGGGNLRGHPQKRGSMDPDRNKQEKKKMWVCQWCTVASKSIGDENVKINKARMGRTLQGDRPSKRRKQGPP